MMENNMTTSMGTDYIIVNNGGEWVNAPVVSSISISSSTSYIDNTPHTYTDFIVYDRAPIRTVNEKYECPYCGTTFIATEGGFIPECKNCGGTLRRED